MRQSLDTQLDALAAAGVTRVFAEKISTRLARRPELEQAIALAREVRASGVAVTLVVHESARRRGKTIGGAAVTDATMLSIALHLREIASGPSLQAVSGITAGQTAKRCLLRHCYRNAKPPRPTSSGYQRPPRESYTTCPITPRRCGPRDRVTAPRSCHQVKSSGTP